MTEHKPQTFPEKSSLTLIKKEDAEKIHAKLINIKKMGQKAEIMLPPQQEKYIKVKKHDFL